jgi:hypothetical protein
MIFGEDIGSECITFKMKKVLVFFGFAVFLFE